MEPTNLHRIIIMEDVSGGPATRRNEDGFTLSGWTEEGDEKKTRSGTDKSVTDRRTHLD